MMMVPLYPHHHHRLRGGGLLLFGLLAVFLEVFVDLLGFRSPRTLRTRFAGLRSDARISGQYQWKITSGGLGGSTSCCSPPLPPLLLVLALAGFELLRRNGDHVVADRRCIALPVTCAAVLLPVTAL